MVDYRLPDSIYTFMPIAPVPSCPAPLSCPTVAPTNFTNLYATIPPDPLASLQESGGQH